MTSSQPDNFPSVNSSLNLGLSRLPGNVENPTIELQNQGAESKGGTPPVAGTESTQRYVRQREIARGGMGAVYEVTDTDLRRSLAMKVLLASDKGGQKVDPLTLARFLEEAQITGQLDHPGIVPLHEVGMDAEGRVYFTMRLVRGRHLGEVFSCAKNGEFGWTLERAIEALIKVAEAMAYAHSKGVVHRDLKPQNIMAGRFGEVYVMDWGLAKVTGRPHRPGGSAGDALSVIATERDSGSGLISIAGSVFGTPAYMSPEQARGDVAAVDARSDIYSFGAILYHLLAGHAPYVPAGAHLSAATVLQCVLDGPPSSPDKSGAQVSAELIAICKKAMGRKPDERYQNMLEIAGDLREWLAGRPVSVLELSAMTRAARWCRRYPWAAAALVAVSLGGGYGVRRLVALNRELVVGSARDAAAQEASILEQVNAYYASDVAGRVDKTHVTVTHDYADHDHAIPIPATFLTTLAGKISATGEGMAVKHYSDYPFKFRGPPHLDEFGQRALISLRGNPKQPVESIENIDGRPVLRYAVARVMTQACVNCHNTHPESVKTDWKVGDVRGVLEIQRPLDADERRSRAGLQDTLIAMSILVVGLVGICAIALLRAARAK